MNQRVPKLRKHATGHWFCHWGGRARYFGKDRSKAQGAYLESLEEWAKWRMSRNASRLPPMSKAALVVDIAEKFLVAKQLEGNLDLRRYYTKHLKRFLHAFGPVRADVIRVRHLQGLKDDMLRAQYAPKTVNHDITAVKTMLAWAVDQEIIPSVSLRGAKCMPLGPPPNKALPIDVVGGMIVDASEDVRPWLAINYLALMRPSEVIRVVHDQGEWVEPGIFRLDRGKIDQKARSARHVVFSDEALGWLANCRPIWSRLDSYSSAVRRSCGPGGPHPLRHSAATHLHQQGADRASIDQLLGHMPSRVSLTYVQILWPPLRQIAALLSLRSSA